MSATFYDYGPGTGSEKYVPDLRLINDPDRKLTMEEVFALPQDTLVYYQKTISKILISSDNYPADLLFGGAKRAMSIAFVEFKKEGGTRRRGLGRKETRRRLGLRRRR